MKYLEIKAGGSHRANVMLRNLIIWKGTGILVSFLNVTLKGPAHIQIRSRLIIYSLYGAGLTVGGGGFHVADVCQ